MFVTQNICNFLQDVNVLLIYFICHKHLLQKLRKYQTNIFITMIVFKVSFFSIALKKSNEFQNGKIN